MIPPTFSDLGKAAKDLFDKKFKFGFVNVESTVSKDPINVKIEGSHDLKSKGLSGSFESKHKALYGIDLTTKWTTKNVLTTEFTQSPLWLKGLKSTALLTFEPDSRKKSLKIKENFKRDHINATTEFLFTSAKPLINLNLVIGYKALAGCLVGGDLQVDSHASAVNRHALAVSYHKRDFTVVGSVQNFSLFSALVHQRVSEQTEVAVSVLYNKQSLELKYGLAAQYHIPHTEGSYVKAKVDQHSRVGLAYGTTVRDGVELSICGEVDGRNFETGPHNIGFGILYEP